MWRVDWQEEAVQARKHSIAMQAERLLQGSPCDVTDVENSLNGAPQGSNLPGRVLALDPCAAHCLAHVFAGQVRAGQGRAGLGWAGLSWAGLGRAGLYGARQGSAAQLSTALHCAC